MLRHNSFLKYDNVNFAYFMRQIEIQRADSSRGDEHSRLKVLGLVLTHGPVSMPSTSIMRLFGTFKTLTDEKRGQLRAPG